MKRLLKHALGGIALFAALSGGALAVPVTLDVLFAGGSIIAGDKLFDNWTFTFDASDPLRTFTESNIEVTALNDGGDNPGPGLSFSVLNGELSIAGDGIYAYVDLQIGFRASVLPGAGKLIKDNSLELTGGSVTGTGDNGYYINESIGTSAGLDDLGEKYVEFSYLDPSLGGPGLIVNLADSADFAPQNAVWVTKNILVWASGTIEVAELTGFQQRFSQTPVPEPASYALVAVALLAAGVVSRRGKPQAA